MHESNQFKKNSASSSSLSQKWPLSIRIEIQIWDKSFCLLFDSSGVHCNRMEKLERDYYKYAILSRFSLIKITIVAAVWGNRISK